MKKIVAIASGGGHWIQLLRLRPAFEGNEVTFVSTHKDFRKDIGNQRFLTVTDASMDEKGKLLALFMQMFWLILKSRPDVVITTGAAPGFAGILFGRLLGAKTIWLDSIANAEELSSSGKHAKKIASIWLTQWQHLACEDGPDYKGKII